MLHLSRKVFEKQRLNDECSGAHVQRAKAAAEHNRAALAIEPDLYETLYNYAVLLERLERPDEALAHYDLGRHLEGDERETHLSEAAEIFERLGARTELLKTRAAIDSGKIAL